MEHSAVIKQNDVVQRWLCWLSNVWVQQSHSKADWNNVVRRNFAPKLLTEWYSPQCATKDLSMWLKQFFDAQDLLCSEKLRPLVVKSDCAKSLCAVVMNSLAFEGQSPITRVIYNNLMLVVLGYAESRSWEKAIVSAVMDRVLGLIPAFHHLCRPHVIRAVRMYVISKERPTRINALSSHHEALLLSVFRHGTCTSTLCEYLVGMALVCYYLTCPTIAAKKTLLQSPVDEGWPTDVEPLMKEVGQRVQTFVVKHVALLQRKFRDDYEIIECQASLHSIDPRNYVGVRISDTIIEDARSEKLPMTTSFAVDRNERVLFVNTKVCHGIYTNLPDECSKPTFDEIDKERKPHFSVQSVPSSIPMAVLDTTESIDGYVDIDNPMFAPELSKYMKEEWVNIAASTNGGIPRLCNIALEAEVSNSNQLSEAKFSGGNHRSLDSVCRKDPGLFIEQCWRDDVRECELWMDNAQKIELIVDETNERRDKKDSRKQQRKKQMLREIKKINYKMFPSESHYHIRRC